VSAAGTGREDEPTAGQEWVTDLEPGVDPGHAASSAAVSQAPVGGSGAAPETPARTTHVWSIVIVVFSVVAIAVLAFLIPLSAAPAWLGIAVQVGCLAWATGTLVYARGRTRRVRGVPLVLTAQVVVTVVLLFVILLVAWGSGG